MKHRNGSVCYSSHSTRDEGDTATATLTRSRALTCAAQLRNKTSSPASTTASTSTGELLFAAASAIYRNNSANSNAVASLRFQSIRRQQRRRLETQPEENMSCSTTNSPPKSADHCRRSSKPLLRDQLLQRNGFTAAIRADSAGEYSSDNSRTSCDFTPPPENMPPLPPTALPSRFVRAHKKLGTAYSTTSSFGAALPVAFRKQKSVDSFVSKSNVSDHTEDAGTVIDGADSVHEWEASQFLNDSENVTLMYAKHEKIPMKDFGSEVRASMDVDHLLNKAVVLLDLQETSLEDIFGKIIHEMDIQEPEFTSEQVKNALFTLDQGSQFHMLSRTVQSICTTNVDGGTFDYDQSWICALCMLPSVHHRHVAIARLSHPMNLGGTMQDLRFIIIVIAPSRAKGTKTGLETARTFATLFADIEIRQRLTVAGGVDQFRQVLLATAKELAVEQNQWRERKISIHFLDAQKMPHGSSRWYAGRGLKEDFNRRLKHYVSDYKDGVNERKSVQKLLSTVVFLYFACLLPSIAFGVLDDDNTSGAIGVKKAIFAQAIGGLLFSIFGGQPMIVVLSTAALSLYIKIIYKISEDFGLDFFALYACVGLWCQFFLLFYALTELSNIMKWATRSAEEIFSLFIALAFVVESFKALHKNFASFYHAAACDRPETLNFRNLTAAILQTHQQHNLSLSSSSNFSSTSPTHASAVVIAHDLCHRETSILHLLLMFGTLWLGMFLYNFRKTPYLTMAKREMLADYALPVSVIVMSFTGAYCFRDVQIEKFHFDPLSTIGTIADITKLPWPAMVAGMGLGFCLSLLFFIDQNITSAIVNNPTNKLKKGSATHFDLLVVAILNIFLSLLGLPWMHGSLPHSPLHLRALADVEERVAQGRVHGVITNVRETRLASMIAHVLICLSAIFLLPFPLVHIPRAVLDGLFLFMALTSVNGNEMFERVLLLVTEQAAYPPTHYIRRVPQRKIHLFTCCQLLQLMLLCAFGFMPYPYIEMVFPMIIFSFFPIRHVLIPKLIDYKYLDALDGRH